MKTVISILLLILAVIALLLSLSKLSTPKEPGKVATIKEVDENVVYSVLLFIFGVILLAIIMAIQKIM